MKTLGTVLLLLAAALLGPGAARAAPLEWGVNFRAGGRYDDMRMCAVTPPGFKGSPSADVSLLVQAPVGGHAAFNATLPVFRPFLYGVAFHWFQFEPDVALLFHHDGAGAFDLVAGPTLGVSLDYGPDKSFTFDNQGIKYFSWGPMVGGYAGWRKDRPGRFDPEYGLSAYTIPLMAETRTGWVVGAMLQAKLVWGGE